MTAGRFAVGITIWFMVVTVCAAGPKTTEAVFDEDHVSVWNRFANQLYVLHQKQIVGRKIRHVEETGEYGGSAARGMAYLETSYYDVGTGQLLSRVRVDRDRPKTVHTVEVFIYDAQGRVERDFASIYLPWSQHAPIRTMINLHQYSPGLQAYRQFDASGNLVYEQCKGTHAGTLVDISLEQQEINSRSTSSAAYQACFAGVPSTAAAYLTPH
jgi:hypothetical protein